MLSFLNHFCLFLKKLCGTLFALFKILIGDYYIPGRYITIPRFNVRKDIFGIFRGTINVDLETIIHLMVLLIPSDYKYIFLYLIYLCILIIP